MDNIKVLKLSKQDSKEFIKALKNPPKANKNLRKAFKDYKKNVKSDV